MKKVLGTVIAACVSLVLASGAYATELNADQVQAVMIGKKVSWVTPDGNTKGVSTYKKNGSASVTVTEPNRFKDKGTWRIVGNQFCSTWKRIRDGKEGCSTLRTTNQSGVYKMDTVFVTSK